MNIENSADAFFQLSKLADTEDVSSDRLGQLVLLIVKTLHDAYPNAASFGDSQSLNAPTDLMWQIIRWLKSLHLATEFDGKYALTLSGFHVLTRAARAEPALQRYLEDTTGASASDPTPLVLQILKAHFELTKQK